MKIIYQCVTWYGSNVSHHSPFNRRSLYIHMSRVIAHISLTKSKRSLFLVANFHICIVCAFIVVAVVFGACVLLCEFDFVFSCSVCLILVFFIAVVQFSLLKFSKCIMALGSTGNSIPSRSFISSHFCIDWVCVLVFLVSRLLLVRWPPSATISATTLTTKMSIYFAHLKNIYI